MCSIALDYDLAYDFFALAGEVKLSYRNPSPNPTPHNLSTDEDEEEEDGNAVGAEKDVQKEQPTSGGVNAALPSSQPPPLPLPLPPNPAKNTSS